MVALRAPLELIVGNSVALNALLDHSKLSSEAALVLCCATLATPARSALASEIVARVHSWDSVAEIATRHTVHTLVYRYLNLECQTSVPEESLAKLRTQWQFVILYNRHLTAELVRLMGLLHVAGIAAVTFKGPVLAAMAYGSIELRQFVDLDILVRQSDLPRVAEILTAERYLSPHTRREGLATGYFQEYEDALFGPDEETFWHRAHQSDLEFGTVNAIAPEDLLLYICVHAAKHGWVQLESICDVAETIRARPGIDLMAILDEATTLGSRRMFLTGIYLAHELVGAPVPSDLVAI